MPVKIEDLTEGFWWIRDRDKPDRLHIVEMHRRARRNGGEFFFFWSGAEVEVEASRMLDRLIAPVAPYREKNNLVVIGWLGCRTAYINVSREEAIARFRKSEGMDDDQVLEDRLIDEFIFDDELWAYDVSSLTRKPPTF